MKIIFAGTPINAAQALERLSQSHEVALVLTREDAAVGRKKILTPSPVAQLAQKLGLKVHKTSKLTDEDLNVIRDAGAELALVVAYGAMIPQTALNQLPWWNLHFSLLPMWRGATPLQHSILHGTKAGVTLFELDKGLDTGKIIAQLELQLGENETFGEALPRFTSAGIELFSLACSQLIEPRDQIGEASYAPKLSRSDARLDFSKTADELHRAVMAFNPEPMAWCEWEGNPIRLLETRSLGPTNWVSDNQLPGRVSLSGSKVLVECAAGTQLEIQKLQPAGKSVMAAGDWFRGVNKEVLFG